MDRRQFVGGRHQHDVGALARLEAAGAGVEPKGARAFDGGHGEDRFGVDDRRVQGIDLLQKRSRLDGFEHVL